MSKKTDLMIKNAPEIDNEGWESGEVKLERKFSRGYYAPSLLTVDKLERNCYS